MSTLSLRLPNSLHNQMRLLAKREGISINQLLVSAAAEKMAALMTEEYLEERARRGNRQRFRAVLAKAPHVAPPPEDSIMRPDAAYKGRNMHDNQQEFTAIGVDGCRGGWLCITLNSSTPPRCRVVEEIAELVRGASESDRIFVDIPIGLPDEHPWERECDKMARKKLGAPRHSSVFPAPIRAVLCARDYEEAKRISQEKTGKKITIQTFHIIPKIKEVDRLLCSDDKARRMVREVHPEVCFEAFAGRPMRFPKSTPEGFDERVAVLESVRPSARQEILDILQQFPRKVVSRDDVVDAMAAAITAAAPEEALRTLPSSPTRDPKGLPMEMVCLPRRQPGSPTSTEERPQT